MRSPIRFPGKARFSALPAVFLFSALCAGTASASPETLVFRNAQSETLYVHIDYDRAPEIAVPPGWGSWSAMEKDSAFVTDSGTADAATHLRYSHAFYAELDGRKAAGTDYIFYDEIPGDEPHYTAEVGFRFPRGGDTLATWISGNGHHMVDDARVVGYEKGINPAREMNMMADLQVDTTESPRPDGLIDFLDRRPGWVSGGVPTPIARTGSGPARPGQSRWAWGGAPLEVPGNATRLLLIDANGRMAWKADDLRPGARLEAPSGLRSGSFRCVWLP